MTRPTQHAPEANTLFQTVRCWCTCSTLCASNGPALLKSMACPSNLQIHFVSIQHDFFHTSMFQVFCAKSIPVEQICKNCKIIIHQTEIHHPNVGCKHRDKSLRTSLGITKPMKRPPITGRARKPLGTKGTQIQRLTSALGPNKHKSWYDDMFFAIWYTIST